MTDPHRDTKKARILTIAGSDSGGGAGIQADIKTMTALGGFAMSAVTALTAQNTQGVQEICDVPAAFVLRQISAVLEDLGADAIKTGMLPKTEIIEVVAQGVDDYDGPLVADPVMVASSGDRLLQDEAVSALTSCVLRRAHLVTPNLPEAEVLTGRAVETLDDMKFAADALMENGVQAALIKGGHLARSGSAVVQDLLATQAGFQLFENPRLDSQNTHGTGCSLASAIATGLGQGLELATAVERGIAYVRGAIFNADPELGRGTNKPLHHGWVLARQAEDG
ncbi:MAG: bifunctional hydroxymethylpyrimidine kinase/phosphomethylpyrimidine kinase [Parvibaculales bacterium]